MKRLVSYLCLSSLVNAGCITSSGSQLGAISPVAPELEVGVEAIVGDFQVTLEGGKLFTSKHVGRGLNRELLGRWKRRGYIRSFDVVDRFSDGQRWHLTLSGSQYGDSSVEMQILSGLTLLVLPYSVDTIYDIQYVMEDPTTGRRFSAAVQEHYYTVVDILLVLALPFSYIGRSASLDAMADHLYEQLRAKGAFSSRPPEMSDQMSERMRRTGGESPRFKSQSKRPD